MNLLVNFNKLESALGRDGLHCVSLEFDIAYAVNWSKSPAADRCILHAYAIQDELSHMRLNTEPALHVPHCAFLAGIAAYSCLRFRRPAILARHAPHNPSVSSRSLTDFPESNKNGELERKQLFETIRSSLKMTEESCSCVPLLRNDLSRWLELRSFGNAVRCCRK